ncbi:hypothetical protein GN244_ATG20499 [Phytophthora infestans]|uniref:Uncharacterized protein n=1 Tax=Phytophthora infestans TaxID=4787 RepID=A0A833VTI1_PHYIN|nr:hypothetical protein GN244_ATG20499 [Phytophthora infestans]
MVEDDQAVMSEVVCGTTRAGKKTPIFWDSDGVDGGKFDFRVVLDSLSDPSNYAKWRGSDRTHAQMNEALLNQIAHRLEAADITRRDSAGAEDFLAATVAGISDDKDLRAATLKRCPHYYELHDVMINRPSCRPRVTSDDIDASWSAEVRNGTAAILQMSSYRPLTVQPSHPANKVPPQDSVEMLLDQQAERKLILASPGRERDLRQKELELKEEKNAREEALADVDLELKRVQLETAQIESVVQLLLSRKSYKTAGTTRRRRPTVANTRSRVKYLK